MAKYYEACAKAPNGKKFDENHVFALTQLSPGSALEAVNSYKKGNARSLDKAILDQFKIEHGRSLSGVKVKPVKGVSTSIIEKSLASVGVGGNKAKGKKAPPKKNEPDSDRGTEEQEAQLSAAPASTASQEPSSFSGVMSTDQQDDQASDARQPAKPNPKTKSVSSEGISVNEIDAVIDDLLKDLVKIIDRRADKTNGSNNPNYKGCVSALRSLSVSFDRWAGRKPGQ